MHRLILTSAVYRQSSRRDPALDAVDSENLLLGRFPLRRLDAEVLRDQMLIHSGTLNPAMFGMSIGVVEDFVGQVVVNDPKPRRSVYLQVRRSKPVSLLSAFDKPTMIVNCEKRVNSTVAPQALMLMNNEFVLKQAELLAQRVQRETQMDEARELTLPFANKYQRTAEAWHYGFGAYDAQSQRIVGYTRLPHFTGSAWQGGPTLPDPKLAYVIVRADGGHTGNDQQHAAIHRWLAPRRLVVQLSGKLKHASANGDGVRGRLVSDRRGLLGEWTVHNRETTTGIEKVTVEAGEILDFAVDCRESDTSDSFEWIVQLQSTDDPTQIWDSSKDFHGPANPSLAQYCRRAWKQVYQREPTPDELELACKFLSRQIARYKQNKQVDPESAALANLCQQLLGSNEFLYVD